MLYLNLGCGNTKYKGMVGIDIVENDICHPDVVSDIRTLPYDDESVDGVLMSHVLEHFSLLEHDHVLLESWRVLKPGGKLMVGVPNLEIILPFFLENKYGQGEYWYQAIYGACRYPGDAHKSGFTKALLTDALLRNGFGELDWNVSCLCVDAGSVLNKDAPNHNLAVIAIKTELPRGRLGEDFTHNILGGKSHGTTGSRQDNAGKTGATS